MAKFVLYIIDLDEATVQGTNDVEQADRFVEDERFIVLHQEGIYFQGRRIEEKVEPLEDDIEKGEDDPDSTEVYYRD